MKSNLNISLVAECNVDTLFIGKLSGYTPHHSRGIAEVFKSLNTFPNITPALGVTDNDHDKPKAFKFFSEQMYLTGRLTLLKKPNAPHYLITVHPAMDGFLFSLCGSYGINFGKYSLPSSKSEFYKYCKIYHNLYRQSGLSNLINALIQKRPEEITQCKSWIKSISPPPPEIA